MIIPRFKSFLYSYIFHSAIYIFLYNQNLIDDKETEKKKSDEMGGDPRSMDPASRGLPA